MTLNSQKPQNGPMRSNPIEREGVKQEVKLEFLKEEDGQRQIDMWNTDNDDRQKTKMEPLKAEEAVRPVCKIEQNVKLEDQVNVTSINIEKTKDKEKGPKKNNNSTKNIVKNYGRAMVIFAVSNICKPYILIKLDEEQLLLREFRKYLNLRKHNIDGISSLRALLLINPDDNDKLKSIKRIFQYSCVIFIKYFSINWIYNSRLGDRRSYLMSRFKILRRIQNPSQFTYFMN